MRDAGEEAEDQGRLRGSLGIRAADTFVWPRRMAYFYCGFFRFAQHSAYLRLLEEVVDRFLDHVGLNIGMLCRERGWIPVVQEHEIDARELVEMEETVYTTFRVTRVVGGRLFDAQVGWYVIRDGVPRQVAEGRIVHGYAAVTEPNWESRLVRLEDWMVERLRRPVIELPVPYPSEPGVVAASGSAA